MLLLCACFETTFRMVRLSFTLGFIIIDAGLLLTHAILEALMFMPERTTGGFYNISLPLILPTSSQCTASLTLSLEMLCRSSSTISLNHCVQPIRSARLLARLGIHGEG